MVEWNEEKNAEIENLASSEELKTYLTTIKDKLEDNVAAPMYALTALNYAFTLPNVYDLFNEENKNIARGIWTKIEESNLHVNRPPLLFGENLN